MIVTRNGFTVTIVFDQPWEQSTLAWVLQTYGPNYFRSNLLKMLAKKAEARKYIQIKQELEEDGSDSGASAAIAWAKGTSDSGTVVIHSELRDGKAESGDSNSGARVSEANQVSQGNREGD